MEAIISVAIGLGLSAACGYRVFVPFLVASAAAYNGRLELAPSFDWIGTLPALLAFATATILEVGAYYVPWLDHLLDTVATPAAVIAGVLASASVVTDLPPLLGWSIALIGGGSAAGLMQGATVLLRLKSAALTGGVANPLVATAELGGATVIAVLAIVVPLLCLVLVVVSCVFVFRAAGKLLFGRSRAAPQPGRSGWASSGRSSSD
jgi:hypothetical protein